MGGGSRQGPVGYEKFYLGHTKCETLIRLPSGEIKYVVKGASQEFSGGIRIGDVSLGVIGLLMIITAIGLDGTTSGA